MAAQSAGRPHRFCKPGNRPERERLPNTHTGLPLHNTVENSCHHKLCCTDYWFSVGWTSSAAIMSNLPGVPHYICTYVSAISSGAVCCSTFCLATHSLACIQMMVCLPCRKPHACALVCYSQGRRFCECNKSNQLKSNTVMKDSLID